MKILTQNNLLGFTLFLATLLLYARTLFFEFVFYDDNVYIYENPHLFKSLSLPFFKWAFTTFYFCNWHPITWLSYAFDWKLYGLWPGGYHLTSIVFHAANAWLIFILFSRMTGAIGKSLLIATIFAWHPVAVESVAWISERKDVLSTFFILLSLIQYVAHVKNKEQPIGDSNKNTNYILCFVFFILSLMCKPMYVTFPIVLMLFDFWPLNRKEQWLPRIVEKIPFVLLSIDSCFITFRAQASCGAIKNLADSTLLVRATNIFQAYWDYIFLFIWPSKLSVYYPYTPNTHITRSLIIGIIFLLLTGILFFLRKKTPALLVGWCFFGISLLPVIGIIKVGGYWIACRYLYLAALGLSICFVWGSEDFFKKINLKKHFICIIITAILIAHLISTSVYLGSWQNSYKLFEHAIAMNPNNWLAHANLRAVYGRDGDDEKAAEHLIQAMAILPDIINRAPVGWIDFYYMGIVNLRKGQMIQAESYFREAAELLAKERPQGLASHTLLRDDSENLMRENLANCVAAFDAKNPSACVLPPQVNPI